MELELDFMEHDYMHAKGQTRGLGTLRNLKVIVKLHMVSDDLIKIGIWLN